MAMPNTEQSELLATLEDVGCMLQKAQTNFKKCPKSRLTSGYITVRIKTIEQYWDDFKRTHQNLTKCTPKEQRGVMPYFLKEEYYAIEDIYQNLHADLLDLLSKSGSHKNESRSQENYTDLGKLPKIQLPIFSGKYEDWPTYQDLFMSLVHQTSLSDVQKLHYLKTSVTGEAELLLRNITITDDNYLQAWEKLKGRFGNKKMILNLTLKKLFGQKKVINYNSSFHIKNILDSTTECITALNNLNIKTDSWDPIIIFLVGQKMDPELLRDWEENSYSDDPDSMPTWEKMKKFLETKFRTLELVTPTASHTKERQQTHKVHFTTNKDCNNIKTPTCVFCKDSHYIYNCKDFSKQTVEERREFVKNNNLCFNCLIPYHNVYNCKQRTSCRVCHRRHHSLLHQNKEENEKHYKQTNIQPNITNAHFSTQQPAQRVLLATAQVVVKGKNGNTHTLRALIDQGSEASFISAGVVDLLGLSKTKINGVVSGVGEGSQIPIKHVVDLLVLSQINISNTISLKAYVLKTISTILPSKRVMINCPQVQTLKLADPLYYIPGKIDLLLGADAYCKIIQQGLIKMHGGIVAQKTSLGWILSGQQQSERDLDSDHRKLVTMHVTTALREDNDIVLKNLWEIDGNLYNKKKIFTKEEQQCEDIYKNTTERDETGRYIVQLPLKQSITETINICGETKQTAITRFIQLERRFENNQKLKKEYVKVINEYKEMGHLVKSKLQNDRNAIYLPHFAVIRDDKDTTKIRIVIDASAKGSNGQSLNDTMLVGPVLQPDLRSLIINWRMHKICVVGDVVKMYRMIKMKQDHTNLQRIIWRDNPSDDLESYNLTTVTFGTAAAPYLAVRTLNQLADDEMSQYPESAPAIKTSFYMDDLMLGNENIEKTLKTSKEIRSILKKGGFEMQKWSSNSEEVLQHLQGEHPKRDKIQLKLDKIIKILGLTWNRKEDLFEITVDLPAMSYPVTKRSVLSDVSRLFDPFGWLSPVIIIAKIFIQTLWLGKLGWDDDLPPELRKKWTTFRQELMHLQNTKVPRWLRITPQNNKDIQLHGFADASTKAYAAVTYLRVVDRDRVYITMVASRTRVAPVKQISLPRLELCAAALLAELIDTVSGLLNVPKLNIFAWTDSMVVLSWLQSEPNRWQTFVANRVADITRVLDGSRWNHVRSADNPADIATRGVKACVLADLTIWWTGPTWLKEEQFNLDKLDIPETQLEKKKVCFHASLEENPIWERFSTITKMKRVLAYCRRMTKEVKPETKNAHITPEEMLKIEEACIRFYQQLVYGKEIENLKKNKSVTKGSSLITFAPYLDEKEILRVGGRLQNASIPELSKHPIIIPRNQHITKLLINEAHRRTLHGGIQVMIAYLRSKYWIIGIKSAVRKCINDCKTCVVYKARVKYQYMGMLPSMRVNQHRAFINSGVDYAGPVYIKTSKGRGQHTTKGYICLFVCMATKAIHLEAVTDLTSEAFLAAFRRFVARRGHCNNIWSDNGTNFVGAAKDLKHLFEKGKNNMVREIAEVLANESTTWHFIPPRMPTYGGLWEAGVQSAKRHLNRVNKESKLTYEEMSTLLAQVEACLNSRPLCPVDDISEQPLTPGHFLVGEPLVSVPELNYEHININYITRWQMIQKMTQDFWRRWHTEYLNTLQQRHKWQNPVSSPLVGDLVVIKEDDLPPTKWLLGRIQQLHPGPDNLVRVVTVRCKGNHLLKRPLYKLIPLPKNHN